MDFELFWGVDYGAQASGTTVIVYYHNDLQQFILSTAWRPNLEEWGLHAVDKMKMPLDPISFKSWHDVDALLAWFIGKRYLENKAKIFGDPQEGLIVT